MKQIKVLCFYQYSPAKDLDNPMSDAVMVTVERIGNVYSEFLLAMKKRTNLWCEWWVGPRPRTYELLGWISENGHYRKFEQGDKVH